MNAPDTTALPATGHPALVLEYAGGRLQLRDTRPRAPGPLWVDLASRDSAARLRAGKGLLLARAVGVKAGKSPPTVVDATAGLGRDACALAALGCTVTALERSPVVYALLADGLRRSPLPGLTLVSGDAVALLPSLPAPDVVLIDPMFPDTGRTALPGKEMQYFQMLPGTQGDEAALFEAARQVALRRVVVKRPRVAPALAPPDVVFKGKSVRFDVYLR